MEINLRDEYGAEWPESEVAQHEHRQIARWFDGKTYNMTHTSLGPAHLTTNVTHNGYVPGDGGHGGKVEIEFQSDYIDHVYGGSVDFKLKPRLVHGAVSTWHAHDTVKVELYGEWERKQFIEALENIINELKNYEDLYGESKL